MIEVRDAHKNRTLFSALAYPAGERPLYWGEMICWLVSFVNRQILTGGGKSKRTLFSTERSWHVIENKALSWKIWERSWNLYENTGT
jgi:hypothetical protein